MWIIDGMTMRGENRVLGGKPVPLLHFSPQIPQGIGWA
jgi:hypothetical protein